MRVRNLSYDAQPLEVRMKLRRVLAIAFLLFPTLLRGDAPGVYALTGATVHSGSGPVIPGGVVIIRNGLIESASATASIPADATVIDVKGMHVYPGLIDAQTSLGFAAAASRRGSGGGGGAPRAQAERPADPAPDSLAARNASISDDDAEARRVTGVTTVVTAPANGIFNGQSALLNLGSGPMESRVIKSPAALQISFNPRPTWTYPDSLMGVVSYIRQTVFDAQQHVAAHEAYGRAPAGLERPAQSAALDALRPVLRRELPVVFVADSDTMLRRSMAIAKEMNLRPILSGARNAYELSAAELQGVPVLVAVKWATAPTDKDDREEQPLRVIRERQLQPTTPSVLAKNRVEFALVSGPAKAGDFIAGIRKAIENGLSAEDALRATTITPARIFGVDRQLGSLERGKIANVIVSDKPLFDKDAKVKRVFVDGREIRLPADDKKSDDAAAPGETGVDGTWALTVRTPTGSVAIQVTLRAEDGKIGGTYSGERGSGDIRGGSLDGNTVEFTVSANAGNEGEATEWVFRGTVAGDTMSGTVSTTIGNFEFSGSRSK
jgi:imidazolonepropionase-like amidohydrolase